MDYNHGFSKVNIFGFGIKDKSTDHWEGNTIYSTGEVRLITFHKVMNTQNQMPPSVFTHRLLFHLEESLKGVDA